MKKIISIICMLSLILGVCTSCGFVKDQIDRSNAEKAYECLEAAEQICMDGMNDIYNTWHFGLYQAGDCSTTTVFTELANETSFTAAELEANGGYSAVSLIYGDDNWQYCLWVVENCLDTRGDYQEVDALLAEAKTYIQAMSDDYEYYDDFKDYYTQVASYADFFKAPTCSFNQLADIVNEHEADIRKAKAAVEFDFE